MNFDGHRQSVVHYYYQHGGWDEEKQRQAGSWNVCSYLCDHLDGVWSSAESLLIWAGTVGDPKEDKEERAALLHSSSEQDKRVEACAVILFCKEEPYAPIS